MELLMSRLAKRNTRLLQSRDFRVPSSFTDDVIFDYLSSLDCPRSLSVWLLYTHGEHKQLLDLPHPACIGASEFQDAYAATLFLSKATFLKTGADLKDAAFSKFKTFEELCAKTNRRFISPHSDPANTGQNVWLLNATKRKIAQILGSFSGDEFVDGAGWGPGVSTLVKGENTSASNKFRCDNGITRDLYSLVGDWFPIAYPCWFNYISSLTEKEDKFNFQVGNKVVTVPKNAKTDRVIAIEPGINLWFQKSIGSMIRRRLLRSGINLRSQETNQWLSWWSSKEDDLATIDFSSASDSISTEVVRELLPPRWFQIMDLTRSRLGTLGSETFRWNKFSSMGNGFTFELETLIFYAAALACCEYESVEPGMVSVYGDDVIIPSHAYRSFSSFCAFLGFVVSPTKSFSSGHFRESCGAHYYEGVDCKPIFLKERLRNVESFYKLANVLRNLAHRRNSYYGCDARFRDCWHRLFVRVPESIRFLVSRQVGDSGFIVNFDEACPTRARHGIEGFYCLALVSSGITRTAFDVPILLERLWQPSIQEYGNTYTLRGRTRTSVKKILVQQWYNLGSWI
jgi:hypothetical protein